MAQKPLAAYSGDAPYIFGSYAHLDAEAVYPELLWLQDQGFNIWYDDGIRVGRDWADELARALENAQLLVFFVTPNSVASPHCRDEINLALNRGKPIISVHLSEAKLTPGLELRLSAQQALLRYQLPLDTYKTRFVDVLNDAFATKLSDVRETSPGHYPVMHTAPEPLAEGIAVLPFVNRSSDPDNEYFSEGMSEEILNTLVKSNTVPVIARTSSFQFRDTDLDVREIATRLNVAHILEGSVQKVGNMVRISAQLIRAEDAVQVWSERFDRELQNVFALQDEIARAIVDHVQENLVGLGDSEDAESRVEVSVSAYDLFLRAQHHLRQVTMADQDQAIELLKQAVEQDPEFTDAWAYLGWAYTSYWAVRAPIETAQLVKPALAKALALDPNHALALSMMGYTQATVDYRWDEGEAMMRKAAQLAPNDTVVQMALGIYLYATFQMPEARKVVEAAYRLDPVSDLTVTWYADILDASGSQKDSQRVLNAFIDTGVPGASHFMASIWMRMGELDKAAAELQVFEQKWGANNGTARVLEFVLAQSRKSGEEAEIRADLEDRLSRQEYMTYWWGDESNLHARIEAGYKNRWIGTMQLLNVSANPGLDKFRDYMNLRTLEGRSFRHPQQRPSKLVLPSDALPSEDVLNACVGTYRGRGAGTQRIFRTADALHVHMLHSDEQCQLLWLGDQKFAHPERLLAYDFINQDRLEILDGQEERTLLRIEDVNRSLDSVASLRSRQTNVLESHLSELSGIYEHEYGRQLTVLNRANALSSKTHLGLSLTLVPTSTSTFEAEEIESEFTFALGASGDRTLTVSTPYARVPVSTWTRISSITND